MTIIIVILIQTMRTITIGYNKCIINNNNSNKLNIVFQISINEHMELITKHLI